MPVVNCNFIPDIKWVYPATDFANTPAGVDIWRVHISSNPVEQEHFHLLLSADELQKASRYHQEKDRERYVCSRAALRTILAKYIHQPPKDIQFEIGANKKPFLKNANDKQPGFNLSHSGDWILIAVSKADVGVDVEKINPGFSYKEIFPVSFSNAEINAITQSSSPHDDFFLYWTRKEALVKATSKGLDDDLKKIPSLTGSHNIDRDISGNVEAWTINSFKVDRDHVGSVAYPDFTFSSGTESFLFPPPVLFFQFENI